MWRCVLFALTFCAAASCGKSPNRPSHEGYVGQWSGTMLQGGSVSFIVSDDQRVTSITVEYQLAGCSASRTYSGLSLEIAKPVWPLGDPNAVPLDYPGFNYASGSSPQEPEFVSLTAAFTTTGTATGVAAFARFGICGNGLRNWNAARR